MRDLIYKHSLLNAVGHGGKADVQAVLGKVLAEDQSLKERIREVVAEIRRVINDVNSLSIEEQKNILNRLGISTVERKIVQTGLSELPNVSGKVVMRLAPYPSGPLHIGNARMVILNDEYTKRYKRGITGMALY